MYNERKTQPRIWIRSPGVSKSTIENSATDFVPIHSGTYKLTVQRSYLNSEKLKSTMKRALLTKMKDALIVKKVISSVCQND